MSLTFKLSAPVQAHGEEVGELTLREPTGDDVIEIGYPYLILMKDGAETGIDIRARVIYSYISKLAGIPLGSAKQIKLSDVAKLQAIIMGFFGEDVAGEGMAKASKDSSD